MAHTFDTKQDAIEAGYTTASRTADKDISGPNSFGYDFENTDGRKTVTVWLRKARNKAGGTGAFIPMYPPEK